MKRAWMLLLVCILAGCTGSGDAATGMRVFIEGCKGPVAARLTTSTFGNSVELTCADFKPAVKRNGK